MDRKLTELEVQNIARAAKEVTLGECILTAANTEGYDSKKTAELAKLLRDTAKQNDYKSLDLLAACAYLCINQLIIPHEPETNTLGFYRM